MATRKGFAPPNAQFGIVQISWNQHTNLACLRCRRLLSYSPATLAGHNKWSKTKHIKAVTDKKKMNERTAFTKTIAMYSKMYGNDIKFNPQLAQAVAAATKASIPKTLIETAIARGQGKSATGAQLESMTMEFLMPPNIALVAEVETDNKNRSLHDLKLVVKKCGGAPGSTVFNFVRRGRATFNPVVHGPTLSDVLEEAVTHKGAEDVEELPDGGFIVWTEPSMLIAITEALSKKLRLDIAEADIVWAAKEDSEVDIDSVEAAHDLSTLLACLREFPEVKAVFANVRRGKIHNGEWEKIERLLDS